MENTTKKKNAIAFDINFNDLPSTSSKQPKKNNPIKPKKEQKKLQINPNEQLSQTQPNEENTELNEPRFQCPECGRKFKKEALEKHAPICQKVFQGKRDVIIVKEDKSNENNKYYQQQQLKNKKAKWENQSNELRAIIQSKRAEIVNAVEKPDNNNTNVHVGGNRTSTNREEMYIECDMCGKKFTRLNYDYHLQDCIHKQKEKQNKSNLNSINNSKNNNNNNSANHHSLLNKHNFTIKTNFNNKPSFATGLKTSQNRVPTMPAVVYGGRPNFGGIKFGK